MSKIQTAEEFLYNFKDKVFYQDSPDTSGTAIDINDAISLIKQFAKLHVKAALEAAAEKAEGYTEGAEDNDAFVDKNTILNAYPDDNIR